MASNLAPALTLFAQLRVRVVAPTLGFLGLDEPAAVNLLLGTAAQETGGKYLAQVPNGPALGFWQIEPDTHRDLRANFLASRPALEERLASLAAPLPSRDLQLASNLAYACAVARLIYFRAPQPLPAATDIPALAAYWKAHYNTAGGAGSEDEFVRNFATYIGAPLSD
jgi:hypothetical protein